MALLAGVPTPPLRRISRVIRRNSPSLNFITLHYIYFITTCLIASVIFWGASTPPRSVSYTDSLFITVSAMTLAGLNTVNLSTLNTFQQFELFFLIIIGSAIFVSAFVVHIRKRAFEKRFEHIVDMRRRKAEHPRSGRRRSRSIAERLSRSLSRADVQVQPAGFNKEAKESFDANSTRSVTVNNYDNTAACSTATEKGRDDEPLGVDGITVMDHSLAQPGPDSPDSPDSQLDQDLFRITPRTNVARSITYRSETGHVIQVNPSSSSETSPPAHITFGPNTYYHAESGPSKEPKHGHHRFLSMQGVGAQSNASIKRRPTPSTMTSDAPESALESAANRLPFTSHGFVSRNSQFHHLTEEERAKLGGYEYKAIQLLAWLVPTYSVLFQLLGALGLGAYVANNRPSTARENGLNPWWVGSFNAISAFNNSGMSLLDANMVAFQTSIYMLLTMSFLIIAGNTCYPIFLRLIVWTLLKLHPNNERWDDSRKTLQFLLDHPRRCYTNMFPSRHTWWLLFSVICLNGIDWAAFEILNLGNTAITSLPAGMEVLDGLFQAFAVRSGGFYVVPIPSVRISLQVLYVIMMYISVYPVVITMRNSNVYEERSLGIYADDPGFAAQQPATDGSFFGKLRRTMTSQHFEQTKSYFVRQQLRAQLAHDLWWIFLAVFLIMVIEGGNFSSDPTVFSVFNVIFETVSAYGCVGISVGLPDQAYSFSGALHTLSKLILCAVMIRGRHRGLPVAIDKAVLLPGEGADGAEEEDAQIRLERTVSRGRVV
jgi:Trk-type K+ transport system membrane component